MRNGNEVLDDFVSRVRDQSDIVSVVSRYLPLYKKGNQYWACCPFHNEKTPSFSVSPTKGLFYCFGCHTGGNAFNFVARMENISYFDAIKLQAERIGIPIPQLRHRTASEIELDKKKQRLIDINDMAKNFFRKRLLQTDDAELGRNYLKSRGITQQTINDFNLGFAPDSWEELTSAFAKQNVDPKLLLEAGLVTQRKNSSNIYDRFRNRIMIPITDTTGHVVAFGGRIIASQNDSSSTDQSEDTPKYLNSPETAIFNKRKILFGLDRAGLAINREGCVIIVEGYMDAISLSSAGIKNVVATLGTAFTIDHVKLLMRYTRNFIFCYDSDDAGQRATMRALPIVTQEGARSSIVIVPDGKDPDDYVRRHGVDAFRTLIKGSIPMLDYQLRYIITHSNVDTIEDKVQAIKQILPLVESIREKSLITNYARKIADAFNIEEDDVKSEWENFTARRQPNQAADRPSKRVVNNKPRAPTPTDPLWRANRFIIRTSWNASDLLQYALSQISTETLMPIHREIIDYLLKCSEREEVPDITSAANELSDEAMSELAVCLMGIEDSPQATDIASFMDSLRTIRVSCFNQNYYRISEEIRSCERNSPEYIQKFHELKETKRILDILKREIHSAHI